METYVKPRVASKEVVVPGPRLIGRPINILRKLIGDDDLYPAQPLVPRKSVE